MGFGRSDGKCDLVWSATTWVVCSGGFPQLWGFLQAPPILHPSQSPIPSPPMSPSLSPVRFNEPAAVRRTSSETILETFIRSPPRNSGCDSRRGRGRIQILTCERPRIRDRAYELMWGAGNSRRVFPSQRQRFEWKIKWNLIKVVGCCRHLVIH